ILFCLFGLGVGLWVTSRTTSNDRDGSAQGVKILRIEPSSLAVGIVGSTPTSSVKTNPDTKQVN
nr:hypothetical protein [Gammaproteobacteria bacterium]